MVLSCSVVGPSRRNGTYKCLSWCSQIAVFTLLVISFLPLHDDYTRNLSPESCYYSKLHLSCPHEPCDEDHHFTLLELLPGDGTSGTYSGHPLARKHLTGSVPMLFIAGHCGDWTQGFTTFVWAERFVRLQRPGKCQGFRAFALDFNAWPSALHGDFVENQAASVGRAIRRIQQIYKERAQIHNVKVILVAHSMGGMVVLRALTQDSNLFRSAVTSIVFLNTPLLPHPFMTGLSQYFLYHSISYRLSQLPRDFRYKTVILSVTAGPRDDLVFYDRTRLPRLLQNHVERYWDIDLPITRDVFDSYSHINLLYSAPVSAYLAQVFGILAELSIDGLSTDEAYTLVQSTTFLPNPFRPQPPELVPTWPLYHGKAITESPTFDPSSNANVQPWTQCGEFDYDALTGFGLRSKVLTLHNVSLTTVASRYNKTLWKFQLQHPFQLQIVQLGREAYKHAMAVHKDPDHVSDFGVHSMPPCADSATRPVVATVCTEDCRNVPVVPTWSLRYPAPLCAWIFTARKTSSGTWSFLIPVSGRVPAVNLSSATLSITLSSDTSRLLMGYASTRFSSTKDVPPELPLQNSNIQVFKDVMFWLFRAVWPSVLHASHPDSTCLTPLRPRMAPESSSVPSLAYDYRLTDLPVESISHPVLRKASELPRLLIAATPSRVWIRRIDASHHHPWLRTPESCTARLTPRRLFSDDNGPMQIASVTVPLCRLERELLGVSGCKTWSGIYEGNDTSVIFYSASVFSTIQSVVRQTFRVWMATILTTLALIMITRTLSLHAHDRTRPWEKVLSRPLLWWVALTFLASFERVPKTVIGLVVGLGMHAAIFLVNLCDMLATLPWKRIVTRNSSCRDQHRCWLGIFLGGLLSLLLHSHLTLVFTTVGAFLLVPLLPLERKEERFLRKIVGPMLAALLLCVIPFRTTEVLGTSWALFGYHLIPTEKTQIAPDEEHFRQIYRNSKTALSRHVDSLLLSLWTMLMGSNALDVYLLVRAAAQVVTAVGSVAFVACLADNFLRDSVVFSKTADTTGSKQDRATDQHATEITTVYYRGRRHNGYGSLPQTDTILPSNSIIQPTLLARHDVAPIWVIGGLWCVALAMIGCLLMSAAILMDYLPIFMGQLSLQLLLVASTAYFLLT